MEGVIRSLNNLQERFHQSFFFYLMPATNRYISIGKKTHIFYVGAFPNASNVANRCVHATIWLDGWVATTASCSIIPVRKAGTGDRRLEFRQIATYAAFGVGQRINFSLGAGVSGFNKPFHEFEAQYGRCNFWRILHSHHHSLDRLF